jgi:hypothetical protein
MPQLDIDLLEDFLFFAFAAFILGFGDEESEENAIERSCEAHLAKHFFSTTKTLSSEIRLISASPVAAFSQSNLRLLT